MTPAPLVEKTRDLMMVLEGSSSFHERSGMVPSGLGGLGGVMAGGLLRWLHREETSSVWYVFGLSRAAGFLKQGNTLCLERNSIVTGSCLENQSSRRQQRLSLSSEILPPIIGCYERRVVSTQALIVEAWAGWSRSRVGPLKSVSLQRLAPKADELRASQPRNTIKPVVGWDGYGVAGIQRSDPATGHTLQVTPSGFRRCRLEIGVGWAARGSKHIGRTYGWVTYSLPELSSFIIAVKENSHSKSL
ncbi:hypothetical protein CPLU01_04000 [Colletotrichum plurivorum]|uniref:Uncharacterized protein n=1 Tax=Colletotrichum plurivorum TaxID=2175906 RepID=A0A8H6KQN6_9PEZI|nr:hypothetical protein CPLU01_04000 [Colletotrichum plurivorum]